MCSLRLAAAALQQSRRCELIRGGLIRHVHYMDGEPGRNAVIRELGRKE
jgi:hypothetical protein